MSEINEEIPEDASSNHQQVSLLWQNTRRSGRACIGHNFILYSRLDASEKERLQLIKMKVS